MTVAIRAETAADEGAVDRIAADGEALLAAARCADMELSILLVGDDAIQALNGRWRGKAQATDVLSFPQEDDVLLGDLVISLETALRQATERGYALRDEVRVLMVHGLLHLLGYDHETGAADLREMAEAEARLMARLGWAGQGLIAAAGA